MADKTYRRGERPGGIPVEDSVVRKLIEISPGVYADAIAVSQVVPEGVDASEFAISGQKVVDNAGSAEALGSQAIGCPLRVKALDTNTDIVAVGNDGNGDVTVSNGFRLAAGEDVTFAYVENLGDLYVDSVVSDEGVCWIALGVKS